MENSETRLGTARAPRQVARGDLGDGGATRFVPIFVSSSGELPSGSVFVSVRFSF